MNWFIWAILSVLFTAVSNILRKVLMKDDKSDPIASSIIFQFLGAVIIGIFAFVNGFKLPDITEHPINFMLNGILWGTATLCLFKTYKYIEASEATILVTMEAIAIIISAVLFLKETVTWWNMVGTCFIIAGVIIVSTKGKKFRFNKGVAYALGFSLFAGLGVTNDTYLFKFYDTLSFLTIAFLIPGIFLVITRPRAVLKLETFLHTSVALKTFLLTFFYVLAAIAFFKALESGAQASQLGPINQSSVIVTVLIAALLLKERDHLVKKTICAILVTIGVLLLK